MKIDRLSRPLSIDAVRDAGLYAARFGSLTQTNLFLKVGRVDDVFVKQPSPRGFEDYRKHLRAAGFSGTQVREIEDAEQFDQLDRTLEHLPGFRALLAAVDREAVHYLVVHKLQHERLLTSPLVGIPHARFGLLRPWRFLGRFEPVFFQEQIEGTTLWDMFDFSGTMDVKPRWHALVPVISDQLSRLLESPLLTHIDWNIQNFVFRERDQRLFYVDLKPTTFVPKESNEHNLKGIREFFLL